MESLKNWAMIAIAACTIAMCNDTTNAFTAGKHIGLSTIAEKDTLSVAGFIRQLSLGSAKEINLSKLAKKRSKNAKVRDYAVKAMDACILVYSDLKPFAQPRGITLADSATFAPQRLVSTLKKSGATGFDRQYLSISIQNHNQAIALLEKGTMFGDTAIVSFSNKQLPVFRRNLEEARFLSKNLSGGK